MARVIWKMDLELKSVQAIRIPEDYKFLSVQIQNEKICIWYECSSSYLTPKQDRKINIAGTGHGVPEGSYIGTVQLEGFVWHIYDWSWV